MRSEQLVVEPRRAVEIAPRVILVLLLTLNMIHLEIHLDPPAKVVGGLPLHGVTRMLSLRVVVTLVVRLLGRRCVRTVRFVILLCKNETVILT